MINAGAIVVTSLIKGSAEEKYNKILNLIKSSRFLHSRPCFNRQNGVLDLTRANAFTRILFFYFLAFQKLVDIMQRS